MRPKGWMWVAAIAAALVVLSLAAPRAQDGAAAVHFADDFESGLVKWEFTDAKAWEIVEDEGDHALGLVRASEYNPPVRSPLNIALVKDHVFGSFELTVQMKQTGREYGHRDLCLFFGYQDPSHFYYVHLASVADDHANSVFLVNGAPRVSIAAERTDGTKWDDAYHTVKIVRDVTSGAIAVYFDDMNAPVMVANDTTFGAGRVGLGSFDDVGHFDDILVVSAPNE